MFLLPLIEIHYNHSPAFIVKNNNKKVFMLWRKAKQRERASVLPKWRTYGWRTLDRNAFIKVCGKLSVERSNTKMIEGPKWSFFELGAPSG